jgi:hypothetical protein
MTTAVPRWSPSLTISKREQMLLKRLEKHRRLFAMLRQHRSELFDDAFQDELAVLAVARIRGIPAKNSGEEIRRQIPAKKDGEERVNRRARHKHRQGDGGGWGPS